MKIIKYLLFALLAIFAIFILTGLLKSSVSYGHTITVDKSVEEAWGVSQDESKFALWLDGFVSETLLSGEKGKVGSTYEVVVFPGEGQDTFKMIETLVSIEEFDHVEMHFDSEMMKFEQTMSFEEEDGKTTISTDSKVMGKGIMMRSMFACMEMLGGSFTAQEAKNIEALKKVIEENTTDYYPAPVNMTVVDSAAVMEVIEE
jgi:hypothetical protein